MPNDVLDYAREKDPRFKDVPDDELTMYIGAKAPEFLKDPDFKEQFQRTVADRGLKVAMEGNDAALRGLSIGMDVQKSLQREKAEAAARDIQDFMRIKPVMEEVKRTGIARGEGLQRFAPKSEILPTEVPGEIIRKTGLGRVVDDLVSDFMIRTGLDPSSTPENPINLTSAPFTEAQQKILESSPVPLIAALPTIDALAQIGGKTIEGMFKGESAVLIPLLGGKTALQRGASLIFGAEQYAALPEQIKESVKVIRDPKSTKEDIIIALGQPGVGALFGTLMMKTGLHKPQEGALNKAAANAADVAPATAAAVAQQAVEGPAAATGGKLATTPPAELFEPQVQLATPGRTKVVEESMQQWLTPEQKTEWDALPENVKRRAAQLNITSHTFRAIIDRATKEVAPPKAKPAKPPGAKTPVVAPPQEEKEKEGAIQQQSEPVLPDVQQQPGKKEGAGEVPAKEDSKKAGAGGGQVAPDLSKIKHLTPLIMGGDKQFTGKSHADAMKAAFEAFAKDEITEAEFNDAQKNYDEDAGHKFLADDGKTVLDRAQGHEWFTGKTGKTTDVAGELHSEDLQKAGMLGHLEEKPKTETKPVEKVQTIAGKMDLTEFERKGYSPEQVTKQDWVNLQRAERRRLGQQEGGDNPNAPWVEYEQFHKDAVKAALDRGEEVDPEVLKDYPDLKPARKAGDLEGLSEEELDKMLDEAVAKIPGQKEYEEQVKGKKPSKGPEKVVPGSARQILGVFGISQDEPMAKAARFVADILVAEGRDVDTPLSEEEQDALLDRVAKKRDLLIDEGFSKAKPVKTPKQIEAPKEKSAADIIAEAGKAGVKGIEESIKGLSDLFGGARLGTLTPGFDETTYAKAKPHFQAAYENFKQAGKSLQEFIQFVTNQFGAGVRDYLKKFIQELKAPVPGEKTGEKTEATETAAEDKLIDRISEELKKGPLTRARLNEIAGEELGGAMAAGKIDAKHLTDLTEVAMNRRLADTGLNYTDLNAKEARTRVAVIKEELDKMPTQTTRTEEQTKMQQFSTPPSEAFVAAWAANIKPTDVVLEPSAGTGGLAVFAGNARVIANELSDRRRALLENANVADEIRGVNAEHINAFLKPEFDSGKLRQPTVVLMNPPFSNAAKTDRSNTLVGAKHVESALDTLPDGGRLVAIVGEGMADDRAMFKPWWESIKKKYNVRANIGVSGDEYRKYGTSFGNQIIVIDKTGATPEGGLVTGKVDKVEDAIDLLDKIRNDRPAVKQPPAESGGKTPTEKGGIGATPTGTTPVTPSGGGARPGGRGPQPGKRPGARTEPQPGGGDATTGAGGGTGAEGSTDVATTGPVGESGVRTPADPVEGITVERQEDGKEVKLVGDNGLYAVYSPSKVKIQGAQPHPTELVESASMASVEPVEPKYTPNIPKSIITSGALSEPQIEQVVYAGQAHEDILPNGERQGYFIGDGTGVGKGRGIAGVITDNWNQGRQQAVWISKTKNLVNDAKRDLGALGVNPNNVIDMAKKPLALKRDQKGVAFLTYTGLSKNNPGLDPTKKPTSRPDQKLNRMQALYDWLGPDFDGVIALDEVHLAGNAVAVRGTFGIKQPAQRALAVVDLQTMFPKARILYVSATGATDVTNLSYGDRLGIWGPGKPFSSKTDFFNKIQAGGLSAMEIVARDLKALGSYMARTLSFRGVEQEPLVHNLTPEQKGIYNEMSKSWQMVFANVDNAMASSGGNNNGRARAAAMSAFWGAQQRFFNQTLTALQMPTIIADMKKELAAGKSLVLQMVNTNEATLNRELADMDEEAPNLEDLDLSAKDLLLEYVDKSFPTTLYEPVQDANGNITWRPVLDPVNGLPVQDPKAVALKNETLGKLSLLKVPSNPMEQILDTFGKDNVAEVTGRTKRVVWSTDETGKRVKVVEPRNEAKRKVESDEFTGNKDAPWKRRILVFTDAGGTGFSYHTGTSFKNQQQRAHYLIQAGWRADAALQGMGRTHRADQVVPPIYKLASTDLAGHQRFISTIARRLNQLGALTAGERKGAGAGVFSEENNLENAYATAALHNLMAESWRGDLEDQLGYGFGELSRKLGFVKTTIDPRTGEMTTVPTLVDAKTGGLNISKLPDVPQFLNRLLAMEFDDQNNLFNLFHERLQQRIAIAKQQNTYDPGTQDRKANAIRVIKDQVAHTHESGAKTRLIDVEVDEPVKRLKWDDLQKAVTYGFQKYVQNIKSGKVYALTDAPSITNPNTGEVVSVFKRIGIGGADHIRTDKVRTEFSQRNPANYRELNKPEAEAAWNAEYPNTADHRTKNETYITGAFLPIWDRIGINNPRIYRLKTDKGTMLGAYVPEPMLDGVRQRLGADAGERPDAPKVFRGVNNNERYELANGWVIKRSKVLGEHRIEVIGPGWNDRREWTDHFGGFMEQIGWDERFFIPNDETQAIQSLEKLLQKSPVVTGAGQAGGHTDTPPPPGQGNDEEGGSVPPSTDPGLAGPGTPSFGQGPDPKAQIDQLEESFRGIKGQKVPLKQQVKEAFRMGERISNAKDAVSTALAGLKATGDGLVQKWNRYNTLDDMLLAKGDLSAEIEKRGWRTRQFAKTVSKAVPSKRDQAAISKWVDAGGDLTVLQQGYADTKPEYKQAYADAMHLSGDLLIAAQNVRNYFESRLQEAIDAGVLQDGVEDYIHRIYEKKPNAQKAMIAHVQSALLKTNPALAKKRVFQFDWEAEKMGYKPVQSFIPRIVQYEVSLSKAIAARNFVKRVVGFHDAAGNKVDGLMAADGRPVLDVAGLGIPVTDAAGNAATLIKPSWMPEKGTKPENRRDDYVTREYPALRKWRWASKDSAGNPIFVQGDLKVHPDAVGRLDALLERSKVRYGRYPRLGRLVLGASSTVKQTMLDFSGFHPVQVTVHGMEHKIMPWKIIKEIDFTDPHVDGLLKGGVTLGGDYYQDIAREGLVGRSLSRMIPFVGHWMDSYHQWLFQDYIPRLKMSMALKAIERNQRRYSNELSTGKMKMDEVYAQTAREANAAFGELNYIMMERSQTMRDLSRIVFLAPDFLEARGRFAAQAALRGGGDIKSADYWKRLGPLGSNEQRMALFLGAATMYLLARAVNKMVDDQYHFEPENAFSVVHKGKSYSLRTVQGDILHLLEHPLQFWMSRLNPVYGRTLLEMATGRDYFGRKRSALEQAWDAVSTVIPISLRSNRERKLWESLLNGMGVTARRWSDVDDAFKLAQKWKDAHGVGMKGEFIYDPSKDPLRPLKVALSENDEAGSVKEIKKLVDAHTYSIGKLNDYFNRYAAMPFTGSSDNDKKFVQGLTEDQKKTVQAAREHKKSIKKLYQSARDKYRSALERDPDVVEESAGVMPE